MIAGAMREAARLARNSIVIKRPLDPLSQLIARRSVARALQKQDRAVAERLALACPLARGHLELSCFNASVELKDPIRFTQQTNDIHAKIDAGAQDRAKQQLGEETPA